MGLSLGLGIARARKGEVMRLLTVKDIAKSLSFSEMTVWRLIHEGGLPAIQIGKSLRVKEEDLESWVEKHRMVTDG